MNEQRRKALAAARAYLEMRGFLFIEQVIIRSGAEMTLIAGKNSLIYFIDVVYLQTDAENRINRPTPDRIRTLRHIALSWLADTKRQVAYQFSAIEIAGPTFAVMNYIDKLF